MLQNISKGFLDTKVPNIEADDEFRTLNKNFNQMIERLKNNKINYLQLKDMKGSVAKN